MSSVSTGRRDLRLDFFRGLALWMIFLDHIPDNVVSWVTLRNYGFSDATEIFIFISGYTASLVYSRTMQQRGYIVAAARILRRTWQLYVAHVFLFAIYVAQVLYITVSYDNARFVKTAHLLVFVQHPDIAIVQALILGFKPANLDVLPVYILLLLAFAPTLYLLKHWPTSVLVVSGTLWAVVWGLGFDIPAYPSGYWYFNPLAWQFLFVFGAWCAVGGAARLRPIVSSRATAWTAAAYLLIAFLIAITWHSDLAYSLEPRALAAFVSAHPIDKTNLHPLRLLHFLALAVIVLRVTPREWTFLKSPLARPALQCGQHSLETFCLGIFLAFVGDFIVVEISNAVWVQLAVSIAGIASMVGVAELISWYQRDRAAYSEIVEFSPI